MPPPESLLVVDDDAMNRDLLSRRLARKGYDVDVAEDGERALAMIGERPFDLILLDVMMPGMSGLEVLQALRKTHSPTELPIIMATARHESAEVAEALELGANDYVTKPLDFPVVLARVRNQLTLKRAVEQIRSLEHDLAGRNKALEEVNARMSRDLRSAARVQKSLLPKAGPTIPGLGFAWEFRPCDELAGDFLNVVLLDATRVGLYVLDVSGHGVASALLSVSVARVLSAPPDPASILLDGDGTPVSPAEIAGQLGRLFPFDTDTEQYFTLIYGILDATTGEFRYVSAGHPGPVRVPAAGEPSIEDGRGFPIGVSDAGYEERSFRLEPGDRLYLYSDGVPEAMTAAGMQFGGARLIHALDTSRRDPLAEAVALLKAEVERWSDEAGVKDDVSILAVEFAGRSDEGQR